MLSMFRNDAGFSYETLRAARYIPYDGADLGEIMSTASRIAEGDLESWHQEWLGTAERVHAAADNAWGAGHRESAWCAYLRASNYYRTAEFFLRDHPDEDPRMLATWRSGAECFARAAELTGPAWRRVTLPYEGTLLNGWFFAAEKLIRGTAHEGAEEHCHAGALAITHQRIFDWLDETLIGPAK